MLLLKTEQDALIDFTIGFDQFRFDAFLVQNGCPGGVAMFSSIALPMPVLTIEFVNWLNRNAQHAIPLMSAAVTLYPAHQSCSAFVQAIARMQQAARVNAAQLPWDACLPSGVPVVNRSTLRNALSQLSSGQPHGQPHGVTLIDGPSGSGRTHSWHLIQHVANSLVGMKVVKVDLDANVAEQQTLQNVFRRLNRKLGLQAREPSTMGATPETVAVRYAEEVVTAFDRFPALKAWLVFDSLDRPVPPEIKMFVCALVHQKLDHELAGAAIFLLGAGRNFGISDPFRRVSLETLTSFLDTEVVTAAEAVNAQGSQRLPADTLAQRVAEMKQDLQSADVRTACSAVASRLVQLRMEVGA